MRISQNVSHKEKKSNANDKNLKFIEVAKLFDFLFEL